MKFIEFDGRLFNVDHISIVGKVHKAYEDVYYFKIVINGTISYDYDIKGSKEEVEKKREELIKLISKFHSIAAPSTVGGSAGCVYW